MKIPFFRGRRKPTSASATSTETFSTTHYFLACFAPLWRRKSTIFHYSSVSIMGRMIEEEEERLKLEISIDDLPDPLLIDILERLPINSVFRSKCVSKKWLSLISDPLFALSYSSRRQKSLSQPFALFYISFIPGSDSDKPCEVGPYCLPFEEPQSLLTFPLNFFTTELQKIQKQTHPLELIGSSSDLLLFTTSGKLYMDSYYVCNPLTFRWISLPPPPRNQVIYSVVGFMVERDGTFWVVQILPRELQSSMRIFQVFCSLTGKWSLKKVKCNRDFVSFCSKTTVVYKGTILYMVNDGLLAFDPKNDSNQCHVMDLPNDGAGKLGVSCGHLYYYEVSSYDPLQAMENSILRVWKMMNFQSGEWVLQHSVRYDHLWSSDETLKQFLLLANTEKYFQWVSFNPVDCDVVFLKCDGRLVSCKVSTACLEILPCDTKQGMFYRLEWDVLPLVFRPWPTDVVQTSKETNGRSSSGFGQLPLSKLARRRKRGPQTLNL